jgi:hypothetical protein
LEPAVASGRSFDQPGLVVGPVAAAAFDGGRPFHGAGGDHLLLFAVQPTAAPDGPQGILVASRITGREIAAVTPPPNGWQVPLSIEVFNFERQGPRTRGSFIVLDAGVEPRLAGTGPGLIHRYAYSYSPGRGLTTTWVETHVLPLAGPPGPDLPTGLLYPGGFVRLPGGGIAVTDTLIGAIWIAGSSFEDWRLAMIDSRFALGFVDHDVYGIGRAPGGGTRAIHATPPLAVSGSTAGISGNPFDHLRRADE